MGGRDSIGIASSVGETASASHCGWRRQHWRPVVGGGDSVSITSLVVETALASRRGWHVGIVSSMAETASALHRGWRKQSRRRIVGGDSIGIVLASGCTRQVASVACGGRGGGNVPRRPDRGKGPHTPDKCQMGLVPQSEVNKQTHIVNRHYSDAEWTQLTPAEKQKIWQLRNPGMTPGTGPTRRDRRRAVELTLTLSSSPGSSGKCQMEDHTVKSNQPADDQGWGRPRNRDNPCLGRQVRPRGEDN